MDSRRPIDGAGPQKPGDSVESGPAPTPRSAAGNDSDQREGAAHSNEDQREALEAATRTAIAVDQDAVATFGKALAAERYVVDPEVIVNRLMEDAALLLPVTAGEEEE